ncbi:MAG: M66 family metalloprotease [Gemmatimonadales bacterium]
MRVTRITELALAFRRTRTLVAGAVVLAACGGGDGPPTSVEPPTTGALTVTVSGLPAGVTAGIVVTGPDGFSQAVQESMTITGLSPGGYTVTASDVTNGGVTYTANPPSQAKTVSSSVTGAVLVAYNAVSPPPPSGNTTLNLTIAGAYLTQAVQRFDGSVPLVAGRNAYLRVFVVANEFNAVQPSVRARLYQGSSLVQTTVISAAVSGVPLAPDQGSLSSSWNVLVPAALVQPGLRVLADVDPTFAVPEASEADNHFPASGTAQPVDVRSLPVFTVRFVPVLQQVNGLQGNVTELNKETFLGDTRLMLPVAAYDADIRAPYTTTAPAVDSDNENGAWGTILSELSALRSADGSSRYYYGVVKASYTSGIAGMGYVGGAARTAVGWDRLPSGSGIMAHELGHNLGRAHAPCGNVGTSDPNFPHPSGQIGVWGVNLTALAPKAPNTADLMGYCSPDWVSDYSWIGMLAYRESSPTAAPPAPGPSNEGLLVWGRITAAGVVLEPAFRVAPRADNVAAGGPHRAELRDAAGGLIAAVAFEADGVGDLPGAAERHFAFVVPLDSARAAALAEVRVLAAGRSAARRTSGALHDPAPRAERRGAREVELSWNAGRFPMALVRDAGSGQVLSFARGGSARVAASSRTLDLELSDGVRTLRRRIVPR